MLLIIYIEVQIEQIVKCFTSDSINWKGIYQEGEGGNANFKRHCYYYAGATVYYIKYSYEELKWRNKIAMKSMILMERLWH